MPFRDFGETDESDFSARLDSIIGELRTRGYDVRPRKKRTAEEQRRIYQQGRFGDTGPIRTERSGEPGNESEHQVGRAADLDFFDREGRLVTSGEYPGFKEAGKLGEDWGLEWGGRWKKEGPDSVGPDPAHLQMIELKKLRAKRTGNLGAESPTARVEDRIEDIKEPERPSWIREKIGDLLGPPPPGPVPMSFGDAVTPKYRRTRDIELEPEERKPYGPEEYVDDRKPYGPEEAPKFSLDPRYSDAPPKTRRLGTLPKLPDIDRSKFDTNPPPAEFGMSAKRGNINLPRQDHTKYDLPEPELADLDENIFKDPNRPIRESKDIQPIPGAKGSPRYWVVTNPRTGEDYNWFRDTPPTQEEAEQFISDKLHRSFWQQIEDPLTEYPSKKIRELTGGPTLDPRHPLAGLQRWSQPEGDETSNVVRGITEAGGDVASAMTSPTSIASTVATLGAGAAANAGWGVTSGALNVADKALSGYQVGHGLYRGGRGLAEGDMGQVGAGALEAGFGAFGLTRPAPKIRTTPQLGNLGPEIRDGLVPYRPGPDGPIYEGQGTRVQPFDRGLGPAEPRRLEDMNIQEGEIIPDAPPQPPMGPPRLPGQVAGTAQQAGQRVEPSTGRTFYAGKYGTGTDLGTVETTFKAPDIPDIEAAPGVVPPRRGGAMRNPSSGMERFSDEELARSARLGDTAAQLEIRVRARKAAELRRAASEAEASGATLEDIGAPPGLAQKLRDSLNKMTGKTGLEKETRKNLQNLVDLGDKEAAREMARRQARGRWTGETGAVGKNITATRVRNARRKALQQDLERAREEGDHMLVDDLEKELRNIDKPTTSKAKTDDNPVTARFRENLGTTDSYPETRFILPDGTKVTHYSYIHEDAANSLGMKLSTALDNGIVRFTQGGAEVGSKITHAQAEQLADAAYYNDYGKLYLDVRSKGIRYNNVFDRGTSPDTIRNWVNAQFVKEGVQGDRALLHANGWDDRAIATLSEKEIAEEAKSILTRDTSPDFEESTSLLQALKEWNKKKGEAGFITPDFMTGGFFSGRGKGKTVRPTNTSKPRQGWFNPAAGTPYETEFAKWVNKKSAARVESVLKAGEFKDLKDLGKDGVKAYAGGSRTGRFKDVANFFSQKWDDAENAGVSLAGARHLTEIFEDSPEAITKAYNKMGRKTQYTFETLLKEIKKGSEAGLTPKFESVPHMIEWYGEKVDRMIANKTARTLFKNKGWVKMKGEGGVDWEDLPNTLFPPANVEGKSRSWVASPEFATLIKNHLGDEASFPKFMGDVASTAKNLSLSAGVPNTGINAHGANIMARSLMANLTSNPKRILQHGKYMLSPKTAAAELGKMKPRMVEAAEDGLSLTTEGYTFGKTGGSGELLRGMGAKEGGWIDKAVTKTGQWFEDPLFQNIIPSIKMKHWADMKDDLIKQGMARQNAGKQAADFTNELYGGINWQAMGRSKDMQNVGRAAILAPDWLETNFRLGKGVAQSLRNPKSPEGKKYQQLVASLGSAYVAANVINFATSGHLMAQNDPGHTLDIEMGTAFGSGGKKKRWIRPFGTAADFVRLPIDAAAAALGISGKGGHDLGQTFEIAKNRASIPGAVGMNLLSKRDRFGRPILGQDDYGRPIPLTTQGLNLGLEASSMVTPPYVKGGIDFARGKVGAEEAFLGGFEIAPLRYSSAGKPDNTGSRRRSNRPSR